MKPPLPDVSSKYGAPMGRRQYLPQDPTVPIKLHLARLRMVDGDYDEGGAYWGGGTPAGIYMAWGEDAEFQVRIYVRALNRTEAKAKVTAYVPGATFYA